MSQQPHVIVLQHVGCETLGSIEVALRQAGLSFEYVRTFEGARVPATLEDACGLIIMGGPMSVYEEIRYPHLRDEHKLIESCFRGTSPCLEFVLVVNS